MRCLDYRECADWCRRYGYPVEDLPNGRYRPAVKHHFDFVELLYPTDSGQKVGLAKDVMGELASADRWLIWLNDWAVWPSGQHMPLFTRFRASTGETRPLIEAPGQVVEASERDDAVSIVAMALLFFWDCHVFTPQNGPVFFCSHDEWAGFLLPSAADGAKVQARLSHWLPKADDEPNGS